MRIAIDAMGGDFAPSEIVKGAIEAAQMYPEDVYILAGDKEKIEKVAPIPSNIEIAHTDQFIAMDESPSQAVLSKKKASMKVAAEYVKRGECDAIISAGNTGALLQIGLLTIGRIKGIKRPALAVLIPTKKSPCLLIDAGANADCKPEYLIQFGYMGSLYMEKIIGVKNPRVALINIGEEKGKGNQFYRQIHSLMESERFNFIGNVEPRAIFHGDTDVAVADGFSGNIVLKSVEASAEFMMSLLREEIKRSVIAKVASLTMKPIFRNIKKRLNHSEHGGALLLGLKGTLIKIHGRADARTVYNAIRQAHRIYSENLQELISEIAELQQSKI